MNSKFTLSFLLLVFTLCSPVLTGQELTVWPGDIDDNGQIDGADLLRWAYAFGRRGEPRPGAATTWTAQPLGLPWDDRFPDSTNLYYADVDGNGRVLARDLAPLLVNHHRTRVPAQPFSAYRLPDATGNHEAVLSLASAGVTLSETGSNLLLEIHLNGKDSLFADFHGLTLKATLPPGLLRNYEQETEAIVSSVTGEIGAAVNPGIHWYDVDSISHTLSASFTYVNHLPNLASGSLVRLALPLAEGVSTDHLVGKAVVIDSLIVHSPTMRSVPTAAEVLTFTETASCNLSVEPVCGSDGVTYLNACFAEAAGVTDYTAGACWNPGLDYTAIDPAATCSSAYEPVCGFNGVTYANACTAEAAGVTSYFTGVCTPGDMSCYDDNLVVISNGTSVNMTTGIITLTCPVGSSPVCGCDGQQYASACLAEAAGVRSYVQGNCNDGCIDVTPITANDDCGTAAEFVCGCNDETYINACFAEAAGVLQYTAGACNGGNSSWCDEATVVSCGDYLPGETTIGAGNQLTSYPGATGVVMQGTDRVYVFEKITAGDLQVGLEITTPNLNMDLFLLTGDCNNYQVVGSSTYSNNQTNNEGIVLEDAPNGTYYIVVDAPFAGPGGDYRLELSCGYLDCSDRVPLTCGTVYNGTNAGGTDDVSIYTCGSTLNVENNGPEIVHSFTITESGPVTVALSGLSANLELFLLDECSRRSCLAYSQHPGTSPESITRVLPAGTYYVVVDGYNGAVSEYSLVVDCTASCGLVMNQTAQTGTNCGQTTGSISFAITGGSPVYTAHYVGPVCRTATSGNGLFTFNNLPPGPYVTYITDANGCELAFNFMIGSENGGLAASITGEDASCGQPGRIDVHFSTPGTAPYVIYLSGTVDRTLMTSSSSFGLSPLPVGTYNVLVQDAAGCSVSRTVIIAENDGGIDAVATPVNGGCGGSPGRIHVNAPNGTLPYWVQLSGPVSGTRSVPAYDFHINDLVAGEYWLTLTDAFGCTFMAELTVGTGGDLDFQVSPTTANCGVPGAALVTIGSGTPPYMINYSGPVTGSETTGDPTAIINGLTAGTYSFSVWDANGCDRTETVFINDGGGNLDFSVTQLFAACDGEDSGLQLLISGGTPNYTVTYTGTVDGTVPVGGSGSETLSLPAGTYTFTATDFGGCSATYEITVHGGIGSANQQSFSYGAGCGQPDNIRTLLNGGEGPFEVTVTTDNCPNQHQAFTTNEIDFVLTNLPNCTYTIDVIDGGGCASSATVTIDVDPDAGILELEAVDGACGGLGDLILNINAGDFPFFITYSGPDTAGSINLASFAYRLRDVPAGTYTFSLTNAAGCEDTQSVTLNNDGTLEVVSSIVTDDCGAPNQIWNDIRGGQSPYTVTATRDCDGAVVPVNVVVDANGFELFDVEPCCYTIVVVDNDGCTTTTEVCVDPANLFNVLPQDGICGQPGGFTVRVMNSNAVGPYRIDFDGPATGGTTDDDGEATVSSLPAGTYTVTVTDGKGCTETETFPIADVPSDLNLSTALINNECGQYNQLWNDVTGGQTPYTIEVTRLCDNTVDTVFELSSFEFELFDLDECCYRVKVTDALGCMVMNEACVEDENPEIFTLTPVPGPCGENGRIDLSFTRGEAPYTVTYTGPQSGDNNTVSGNALRINDAPPGLYTFTVTDTNGCTETESTTLEATTNDLVLQAALIQNDCGQYDQIWIDIFNGTGPFSVEVIRLCDGTTLTEFVSGEVGFELFDLEPCDYKIIVTDQAGCMVMNSVTVVPSNADLVDITIDNSCDSSGFYLDFVAGSAPYRVVIAGPITQQFLDVAGPEFYLPAPSGDYMIRVFSADGCDQMSFMGVVATDGTPPVAAFDTGGSDLGVIFANNSTDALVHFWDFGDGNTSTDENPEYVYAAGGTYTVCLTATNDCGTDQRCEDVTVSEGGNLVQIVIGGDRQAPGGTARIPVSIQGTDNISTISGTFELATPGLATISHVSAGAILPQFNPANNSFTFVASGTAGVDLTGDINVLFFLHLDLGVQTGVSDVMLNESPVSLEVSGLRNGVPLLLNASYLPGFVEISDNLLGMMSSLAYDRNDQKIEPVVYRLSEPDENYTLDLPENNDGVPTTLTGLTLGRMYYVEPVKNTDPINGLSSFEIFLAQRLLLGLEVPQITEPLQIVGMDMNCSQSVSTLDLLIMQRLLIGDLDEAPGCNSWTFVPDSHDFPVDYDVNNVFPAPRRAAVVLMSDSMVTFTGMKTGDLLADADPGRNAGALPLEVQLPENMTVGNTVGLPLTLAAAHELVSFQGELVLAEGLEFVSADGLLLTDLAVGERLAERGRLQLSWFSPTGESTGAAAGAELVEVAVNVTAAYVPGTLPFIFDDGAALRSEAYNARSERFRPEVHLIAPMTEAAVFRLHPATPNPAAEYTDLTFELPAAASVELTVLDGLGRPVITRTQTLEAGTNRFRLDTRVLVAGTYYYQLVAGEDVGAAKVVVK